MSFQESAESLRSRLHLGDVRPSVLVGMVVVAAVVVTCVAFAVAGAVTTHEFEVTQASEADVLADAADTGSDDATTDAAASQDGSESQAGSSASLCVYVTGCVENPGICYVAAGARVADAIEAVGGFTEDAATDAINLARVVADGEQITVLSIEEAESASSGSSAASSGSGDAYASSTGTVDGKVNINTADSATLQTLSGIGEVTAEKIIADREANGPFETIEDITRVSGIGDKKFEAIKDSICVG